MKVELLKSIPGFKKGSIGKISSKYIDFYNSKTELYWEVPIESLKINKSWFKIINNK